MGISNGALANKNSNWDLTAITPKTKGREMPKLELAILVGKESKEWLARLEAAAAKIEKASGKKPSKTVDDEDETTNDDGDEDEKPVKNKKKKPVDDEDDDVEVDLSDDEDSTDDDGDGDSSDDDEDGSEDDEGETEDEDEKPAKKKPSGPTLKEVGDAFKRYAGKKSRADALSIIKKFKLKNINDARPADFGKILAALKLK